MKTKGQPDICINDISDIIGKQTEMFYLSNYCGKSATIKYSQLMNLTLGTILDMISQKQLYFAKIIIIDKTKVSVTKKYITPSDAKQNLSNSKISLDDIYK